LILEYVKRIDERVLHIEENFKSQIKEMAQGFDCRIRVVENWQIKVMAVSAAVSAIVVVALKVLL
jgi:hypothetical protein